MAGIKDYSVVAASNTLAPPDGAPEGMLANTVNNTMREMMALMKGDLPPVVANVVAVKALVSAKQVTGNNIYVTGLVTAGIGSGFFRYDSGSAAVGDDIDVIEPTDSTGRWLRNGQSLDKTDNVEFVDLKIATMGQNWTNATRTVADMGIVTLIDINGGTIDGTIIGASAVAAGSFAALIATTGNFSGTVFANNDESAEVGLVVGGATASGNRQQFIHQAAGGQKNWQIGTSLFAAGDFAIGRSTANDGTTFSVGDFQIDSGGTVIINPSAANIISLEVKGNSSAGIRHRYINQASSGQRNWQIGIASHASQTLSIAPSTAADGTTFTTPILNLDGATDVSSFVGDVDPRVTETLDIGSASLEWDNIFLQNAPTVCDIRRKNDLGSAVSLIPLMQALDPRIFSRKSRVVKDAVSERTEQRPKTKIITVHETVTEIIDGVPVVKMVKVKRKVEVGNAVQAVDENGNKMPDKIIPAVKDEDGKIIKQKQIIPHKVFVPEMETVTISAEPEVVVPHGRPHSGFMAQAVKAKMDELGIEDWAGYAYHNDEDEDVHVLRLMEFIAPILAYCQEIDERLKALE